MRTTATEERMFVVSDLHLGNPGSTARGRLVGFLDHALRQPALLCINGDGFDLVQTSFPRLAGDTLPVMAGLRRLLDADLRVYYVVGNHDMVLEHFLSDLVFSQISPFLNVCSGDRRIRVEHGHIYDPWFSPRPRTISPRLESRGISSSPSRTSIAVWDRVGRTVERWNGQPRSPTAIHRTASWDEVPPRGRRPSAPRLRHRDLRTHAHGGNAAHGERDLHQWRQLAAGQQLRRHQQRHGDAVYMAPLTRCPSRRPNLSVELTHDPGQRCCESRGVGGPELHDLLPARQVENA